MSKYFDALKLLLERRIPDGICVRIDEYVNQHEDSFDLRVLLWDKDNDAKYVLVLPVSGGSRESCRTNAERLGPFSDKVVRAALAMCSNPELFID